MKKSELRKLVKEVIKEGPGDTSGREAEEMFDHIINAMNSYDLAFKIGLKVAKHLDPDEKKLLANMMKLIGTEKKHAIALAKIFDRELDLNLKP